MREYIDIINEANKLLEDAEELICDYTSKKSIRAMVDKLYFITPAQRLRLAIFVTEQGLMLLPFAARMTLKMAGKNKRKALEILFDRNPELIETFWKNTLDHILTGHDTYDKRSAGGFSKQELEQLFAEAHAVGFPKVKVVP